MTRYDQQSLLVAAAAVGIIIGVIWIMVSIIRSKKPVKEMRFYAVFLGTSGALYTAEFLNESLNISAGVAMLIAIVVGVLDHMYQKHRKAG